MQEQDFDSKAAEKQEIDNLLDRGVEFVVDRKSIFRHLSKSKTRKFIIKRPCLGTMITLAREFVDMHYNETLLKGEWFEEGKRMVVSDAERCARVAAICVLNDEWKLKHFTGILTNYFLWRMDPKKLTELTSIIIQISNLTDFINSIKYLSIKERVTAPNLIETMTPGKQQV